MWKSFIKNAHFVEIMANIKTWYLIKKILNIQGKTIKLKPNLNFMSYGIYVAICTRCNSNYVGKTKNSFTTRWTAHIFNWKWSKSNYNQKDISDENVLYRHYYFMHKNNLRRLNFDDAYEVTFLEEPGFKTLNYKDHFWTNKL